MSRDQLQCEFALEFIEPPPPVRVLARKLLDSPDDNCRSLAKAVLDVAKAGRKIKTSIAGDKEIDLAPYFDFWFGDALDTAQKLLHSDDKVIRQLAQCLIEMEKAVVESKENFLVEMKRLGFRGCGEQ
jgi:hypothetical protein